MTENLRMGDESSAHRFRSFGIIPAAGRSARMGQPKLLLPWKAGEETRTVLDHVLAAWCSSQVTDAMVVLHPEDRELAEICRRTRATAVIASSPPPDMKTSIQHALNFVESNLAPANEDVFLVAPADMPLLTASVIDLVLSAHNPQHPKIIVPRVHDRRGHPVLFPWTVAVEVKRLPFDVGLNQLLKTAAVSELEIQQPAILADLDTPEDYRRLQPRSS